MFLAFITSGLLVALATVLHYEALRNVNARLPSLYIARRAKLLVVVFAAMIAHIFEIGLYAIALYILGNFAGIGSFAEPHSFSPMTCLFFSAEAYTSLGFGDLILVGPIRLLAGVEALNGLVLIGWTASYTYIAMERFWES